jgi:hypothetical protein
LSIHDCSITLYSRLLAARSQFLVALVILMHMN